MQLARLLPIHRALCRGASACANRNSSPPVAWALKPLLPPFCCHERVFVQRRLPAVHGGRHRRGQLRGGYSWEGISNHFEPEACKFGCVYLPWMIRNLSRLAPRRPFASQFGRIGFVIAWYIISSLRNGGPYNSYPLFSFSLTFRTSSSWVAASA